MAAACYPRLIWAALHTFGLGLLWLCGAWSPLSLSSPISVIVDALAFFTLSFYAAASLVDPGYLEQQPLPSAQKAPALPPAAQLNNTSPLLEPPHCVHCRAFQVARAKHCHDCGRCVERLDHHCWWLGSCVGRGNHRLFLTYLTFEASLLVVTGATAATRGIAADAKLRDAASPWPPVAIGCAFACVAMCGVLGLLALTLLAFQCGLILRGETTWEHLRRERINAAMQLPPHVRPYDGGPTHNVLSFLQGGARSRNAAVLAGILPKPAKSLAAA